MKYFSLILLITTIDSICATTENFSELLESERKSVKTSSDQIHFPNYFSLLGDDKKAIELINQSIGSILNQLKILHFKGKEYTNRDFFKNINDIAQQVAPGAKTYISGGTIRSILGYIYKKMRNQAAREGDIRGSRALVEDVFNRIIMAKSRKYNLLINLPFYEKDLTPLDALGIGSDYDILIEFPKDFKDNKQKALKTIKNFIDKTGEIFGIEDDHSGLTRMIIPVGDVREYQIQIEHSAEQGGTLIDLLAYPLTGGSIREPESDTRSNHNPSIMQNFVNGVVNYVKGKVRPDNPKKQTIRGLRPLLEIPFLKVDETSQKIMIEELNQIQSLDDASKEQCDKMARNARFQGGHNRFSVDCNHDLDLGIAVKNLAKRLSMGCLIPEFIDKGLVTPTIQDEALERLLMPLYQFLDNYTVKDDDGKSTGILYHGTPKLDNLLSMIRSGLFVSRPDETNKPGQGSSSLGRGVYTTVSLSIAEHYAGTEGVVIPLTVNMNKTFRILDVRRQDVKNWLKANKLMLDNLPDAEKLYRDYGIDVVVSEYDKVPCLLIQNQEVVNVPKDIVFLIKSMYENALSKLKRGIFDESFLKLFNPKNGYLNLLRSLDPSVDVKKIATNLEQAAIMSASEFINNFDKIERFEMFEAERFKDLIELFQILVEKGRGYREAIMVASNGMKRKHSIIQRSVINLLNVLVKKGHGYKEAIVAASERLRIKHKKSEGFLLFKALFEKKQGYKEAITILSEGITSPDCEIKLEAIDLFQRLFEKEQDYKDVLTIALDWINSDNRYIRSTAISLFDVLLQNKYACKEALMIALDGIKNKNRIIRLSSLKLFKVLVENGYAYDIARTAASDGMKSSDRNIRSAAIKLFGALFEKEKEYAYGQAITAASENENNKYTKSAAIKLRQLVIDYLNRDELYQVP